KGVADAVIEAVRHSGQASVCFMAAASHTTCRRKRYAPRDSFVCPGLGLHHSGGAAAHGAAPAPACVSASAGGGPPHAIAVAIFCWGPELHHPERPAQS